MNRQQLIEQVITQAADSAVKVEVLEQPAGGGITIDGNNSALNFAAYRICVVPGDSGGWEFDCHCSRSTDNVPDTLRGIITRLGITKVPRQMVA